LDGPVSSCSIRATITLASEYASPMAEPATGRPGRPAASTREAALQLATERFQEGQRVDVQAIARELGLARATMHRWFQTRELLLGELLAALAERRLHAIRADVGGEGPEALLVTLDRFNREIAANRGMRALLAQEPERALRILTSGEGIVQPRVVAAMQRLIEVEVDAGTFTPPILPELLAYATVRLGEAFIYNDALTGIRGDTDRLNRVEAALFGVPPLH
jgi:AcrR family transcriptional regulator